MSSKEQIEEKVNNLEILNKFPDVWQNRFSSMFFCIATDKGESDPENKAKEKYSELLSKNPSYGIPEYIYLPEEHVDALKVGKSTVHYALVGGIYSK